MWEKVRQVQARKTNSALANEEPKFHLLQLRSIFS